ncbi:MAG: helix-turn-helix domain-containing protein [Rhizobiaceae bacterium]|nr:helix-turn-helix domain-containing protein [Rhizobiaceae bacterium]
MTPFGKRVRELRSQKKVTQKAMAAELGVSAAYLSALENGQRGSPSWEFVQRIIGYFNVIWDDAEELQELATSSQPKAVIDTSALSWEATELTNYLAKNIHHLAEEDFRELLHAIKTRVNRNRTDWH